MPSCILYSKAGFTRRNIIKNEMQATMEQRNLRLCCVTCGFVTCFAGCCKGCGKCYDAEESKMNEHEYCRIIRERFLDEFNILIVYDFSDARGDALMGEWADVG